MSLLTRLVAPLEGEIKLPVHQFTAAIAEYKRSATTMTGADLVSKFDLTGGEITTLQQWQTIIDSSPESPSAIRGQLEDVFILGERGQYSMVEVESRLDDLGMIY
jgi:hypothetical protein